MNIQEQLKLNILITRLSRIDDPYHRTCFYILDKWLPDYKSKTGRKSSNEELLNALRDLEDNKDKDYYISFVKDLTEKTEKYLENTKSSYYLSPHKFLSDIFNGNWEIHEKRFKRFQTK
jgi:hypothetical protein